MKNLTIHFYTSLEEPKTVKKGTVLVNGLHLGPSHRESVLGPWQTIAFSEFLRDLQFVTHNFGPRGPKCASKIGKIAIFSKSREKGCCCYTPIFPPREFITFSGTSNFLLPTILGLGIQNGSPKLAQSLYFPNQES